jgi:hypothetical protein
MTEEEIERLWGGLALAGHTLASLREHVVGGTTCGLSWEETCRARQAVDGACQVLDDLRNMLLDRQSGDDGEVQRAAVQED